MNNNIRAIILAAGRGSRMGSLTDHKPKCLNLIKGKPLIEYQIKTLKEAGIHHIGIVTGYHAEMLCSYDAYFFHNPRWAETNMVSSLMCAQEWLNQFDCIVAYSDIVYGSKIIRDLMSVDDDIAIAYDPDWLSLWSKRFDDPLCDAESFSFDANNYLLDIGGKSLSINEIRGQYMGLLKFVKNSFQYHFSLIDKIDKVDMTSFLSKIVQLKALVKVVPNYSVWGECDTENDLKIIRQLF